jgi:hypothetical protein
VPPVPDKTLNDSTLNGVDTDNNGIRDDIDRYIAEHYPEPIVRAIAQLNARTFLDIFQDPANAYEKKLYISSENFIYCKGFIGYKYGKETLKGFNFEEFDKIILNNSLREKAYWKYNGSLGGHSYRSRMTLTEKDCPAEINNILKDYKKIK